MELIKVFKKDGKQLVDAKELYLGIGLNKAHWKRWAKMNIEDNEFFLEGVDWVYHDGEKSKMGRPSKNYVITLEFAKHIAMMSRAKRSHEYRNYLIDIEEKAQKILSSEDKLFIEMGRGKKLFEK